MQNWQILQMRTGGVFKPFSSLLVFSLACLQCRHGEVQELSRVRPQVAEKAGSDDSHGRALWSLGKVLGASRNAGLRGGRQAFRSGSSRNASRSPVRARGVFHPGNASVFGLGFPATEPSRAFATILANRLLDIYERKPFRDVEVVREESLLLERKALAGAYPGRMEER